MASQRSRMQLSVHQYNHERNNHGAISTVLPGYVLSADRCDSRSHDIHIIRSKLITMMPTSQAQQSAQEYARNKVVTKLHITKCPHCDKDLTAKDYEKLAYSGRLDFQGKVRLGDSLYECFECYSRKMGYIK